MPQEVFINGNWIVGLYKHKTGYYRVYVQHRKYVFCEYPVEYIDGTIAYDRPHAVPMYIKEQVKKACKIRLKLERKEGLPDVRLVQP